MNAKQNHTPGPWSIIYGGQEGDDFAAIGSPHSERAICVLEPRDYQPANAARIVACVNACEAFEDPAEAIRLLGIEAAKAYPAERERDVLRAEVERLKFTMQALFDNCAMPHKYWGEGSNQREADEAIKAARAALGGQS